MLSTDFGEKLGKLWGFLTYKFRNLKNNKELNFNKNPQKFILLAKFLQFL